MVKGQGKAREEKKLHKASSSSVTMAGYRGTGVPDEDGKRRHTARVRIVLMASQSFSV